MKISIIIVAYKHSEILIKTLNSIHQYNDLSNEIEVIVVDNSPEDERVCEDIKKSILKDYIYIQADNKGFGAGNNIGAQIAKGEILAFINPDIIFIEPIFKKIYDIFLKNNKIALQGCKLLNKNLKDNISFCYNYESTIMSKFFIKILNKFNLYNADKMYISGANIFIRKNIFDEIGQFDENLFMYFEEPDLCKRVKFINNNNRITFNKDVKMIHLEGITTSNNDFKTITYYKSLIYFGKKHKLNYLKKLKFEYNYHKLKNVIFTLLNSDKKHEQRQTIKCIENNFSELKDRTH